MIRLPDMMLAALIGSLLPGVCYGQAAAIVVSQVVADDIWIERQCKAAERVTLPNEAVRAALERARQACDTYRQSLRDHVAPSAARDAWVKAILAIQDDVGRLSLRTFIPEIGPVLPPDLKAYSLFLFPDDRWRSPAYESQLRNLERAFEDFGHSLGDDRAAIWFLDQDRKVDVLRSREYCNRFLLNYNDGPYLVTTLKRPDLLQQGDEIVVIRLGGIAPDRMVTVLNQLSQNLSLNRDPSNALLYEELKQRVLTSVENFPLGVRAFVSTVFAAP